jgi:hypothetical protein
MSGSAALEYGFPSTHSTNAVSAALLGILVLNETPDVSFGVRVGIHAFAWIYTLSIVFGRLYCGMHGFLDVFVGIWLGAVLAIVQWRWHGVIDAFVYADSVVPVLIVLACILVLVRIHPEPADACPCFDDGVAFAAVVGGVQLGCWHFAKTKYSWTLAVPGTAPYSYAEIGLIKSVLRVVLGIPVCNPQPSLLLTMAGIVIIFAWREVAKPTFHHFLPPVYRIVERIGLILPRKHFTPAS